MSSMTAGKVNVSTDPRGQVATITIDRGTPHAALTLELLTELEARINQVVGTTAQVVILRTPSTKLRSVGIDIAAVQISPHVDGWRQWIPVGQRVFGQLAQLPQPTIAVVDGLGIGGGAELALACDFRIATDRARIGRSEVGLGTIAGWGGTQRLNQLIGAARARKATKARDRSMPPQLQHGGYSPASQQPKTLSTTSASWSSAFSADLHRANGPRFITGRSRVRECQRPQCAMSGKELPWPRPAAFPNHLPFTGNGKLRQPAEEWTAPPSTTPRMNATPLEKAASPQPKLVYAAVPSQRSDLSGSARISQGSHAEQFRSFGLGEAAPYSVWFSNS